ncbi:MAG: hypothetical protein WCP55_25470, partial [Lentisphaerota bacterium]
FDVANARRHTGKMPVLLPRKEHAKAVNTNKRYSRVNSSLTFFNQLIICMFFLKNNSLFLRKNIS